MSLALRSMCGLVGLLFLMLGVRWMFSPEAIAAESGIALLDTLGFNTARGDIGGLFISGAVLVTVGLLRAKAEWLRAMAVMVGCVALGRAVGMLLDGFAGASLTPFVIELIIVAVMLGTARDLEKSPVSVDG